MRVQGLHSVRKEGTDPILLLTVRGCRGYLLSSGPKVAHVRAPAFRLALWPGSGSPAFRSRPRHPVPGGAAPGRGPCLWAPSARFPGSGLGTGLRLRCLRPSGPASLRLLQQTAPLRLRCLRPSGPASLRLLQPAALASGSAVRGRASASVCPRGGLRPMHSDGPWSMHC
jgi:hypothetical protein